ncbi:hypothetical protein C0431_00100 [bacterium]|nr:hypothetical protein [bacterium]
MAIFRSGRQRRLVVTGSWQCPIEVEYRCTREWPVTPNRHATLSEKWPEFIEVRGLGMKARLTTTSVFSSWPTNSTCTANFSDTFSLEQELVVGDGLSFETGDIGSYSVSYSIADGAIFALDPTATFLFYADVEEWFEVIDPIEDSDALGFPNFGGDPTPDSVNGRGVRFFERLRPGGELGATLSGMVPIDVSLEVTQAMADEYGDVNYALDRRGQMWVENDSGLMTISGSVADEPISMDYFEETGAGSLDGRSAFVLSLQKGLGDGGSAYGFVWGVPATKFRWRGVFFVGSDVLSDDQIVRFERRVGFVDELEVAGSGVLEFEQMAWQGFGVIDGVSLPSLGFDDRRTVRHWLDGDHLAENGDERADWRLQFRGKEWVAFTASHPESVILDDGSSLSGWSGSGVDLSVGIAIDVGSAGGSVVRSFEPVVRLESYRFLEFEVRSVGADGLGFGVGIGDKFWRLATGDDGIWVTRRIDLCHPTNGTLDWDEKESRYPLDELGDVSDSDYWGVSRIENLSIFDLEGDAVYEIRAIRLIRVGEAKLSFLPAFRRWGTRVVGEPLEVKPLFWSEVDGRIADTWGMSRLGGYYGWRSISEAVGDLQELGWLVNPGLAIGDGFHSNLREAELIWGGGVRQGGLVGVDLAGSEDLPVFAAALWDEVTIYPGAGDVWANDGEYGVQTRLDTGKILRGKAWGLALDESGSLSGYLVELIGGSTLWGSDLSDSRGFFLTGLPGGQESGRAVVRVGGWESPEFSVLTRMRHRRALREQASLGGVSFDWHPAGLAVRASLGSLGLRVSVKGNGVSSPYSTRTVGFSAASLAIRWDLGRKLRLVLVTEEEGQIKERFSDDLGENWSMATTLAVGNVRYPGLFIHPDGRRFVYWIEDGNVNGVIRDRSGAVLSSVSSARSGVGNNGLAVGGLDQMGGRFALELVTVESDMVVSSLSTDGVTFS